VKLNGNDNRVELTIESLFMVLLDLGLNVPDTTTVRFWVDVAEYYQRTVRITKSYVDASLDA